jgi:recombination protein RecR
LSRDVNDVRQFGQAIIALREQIKFCKICHNISDADICNICSNKSRNQALVCVVENLRDMISVENTNQYNGVYHVLGGLISPLEGIGPEDVAIASLVQRVEKGDVTEIIMALSPTIEGDTTIFYISKKLQAHKARLTSIARGVSFGGDLEYVDDFTLARSIANRQPYENYLVNREG